MQILPAEAPRTRTLHRALPAHRTRKAILGAVRAQARDRLDESIEEDKEPNPFLHGVPGILDALRSGQIECRVYGKDKFSSRSLRPLLLLDRPRDTRRNRLPQPPRGEDLLHNFDAIGVFEIVQVPNR